MNKKLSLFIIAILLLVVALSFSLDLESQAETNNQVVEEQDTCEPEVIIIRENYVDILEEEVTVSISTGIPNANVFLTQSATDFEYLDIEWRYSSGQNHHVDRISTVDLSRTFFHTSVYNEFKNDYSFRIANSVWPDVLIAYYATFSRYESDPLDFYTEPWEHIVITNIYGVNITN